MYRHPGSSSMYAPRLGVYPTTRGPGQHGGSYPACPASMVSEGHCLCFVPRACPDITNSRPRARLGLVEKQCRITYNLPRLPASCALRRRGAPLCPKVAYSPSRFFGRRGRACMLFPASIHSFRASSILVIMFVHASYMYHIPSCLVDVSFQPFAYHHVVQSTSVLSPLPRPRRFSWPACHRPALALDGSAQSAAGPEDKA